MIHAFKVRFECGITIILPFLFVVLCTLSCDKYDYPH